MALPLRDVQILAKIAHLGVAKARQVQRLFCPDDFDGRKTRRRLQVLTATGLLQKMRMEVVSPLSGMNAPVYGIARKGLELLAIHFEDARFLALSSQKIQWQHLAHAVAISEQHVLIDQAMERETAFSLENWTNEFDIVCKDAAAPEDRFRLYTLLSAKGQKPRLVCAPDYMFVLRARGPHGKDQARVLFGELERATSHWEKAAAEKSPGYADMARRKLHRRFCTDADEKFFVLVTAPDAKWRDHLVKAFGTRPEPTIYRFAAQNELTPATFFRGEVWHRWEAPEKGGELRVRAGTILKPPEAPPGPPPGAPGGGGNGLSQSPNTSD